MIMKHLKDIVYLSSKLMVRQVRFALASVAVVLLVDIPFAVVTWAIISFNTIRDFLWRILGGSNG